MARTRDTTAVETMITMYQAGYNVRQIAEAVYYSKSLVHKRLREAGCDLRSRGRQLRPDEPQTPEIIRLYKSGLSLNKIAEIVPMSASGIYNRLTKAGVKLRPQKNRAVSDSTIQRIKELCAAGNSFYKTAKLCGVSVSTVRRYAKNL